MNKKYFIKFIIFIHVEIPDLTIDDYIHHSFVNEKFIHGRTATELFSYVNYRSTYMFMYVHYVNFNVLFDLLQCTFQR